MNKNFQAAIEQEIAWKNAELKQFCIELVRRALEATTSTFTTDIVPDEVRARCATTGVPGNGIAGSAAHILKTANVIELCGHTHGGKFFAEKVVSSREGRNAATLCLYRLTSVSLAREFLRRQGVAPVTQEQQPEFFSTSANFSGLAN